MTKNHKYSLVSKGPFLATLFTSCLVLFIAGCSSLISKDRNEAMLHLQMSNSYIENNSYPQALNELLIAEKLDPKNPLVHNNLGIVYYARLKYALSEKHFNKAIEYDPLFTDARNNLARVYIAQKKYNQAIEELNKVFADLTYPYINKAQINMGIVYFEQKKYAIAKKHFFNAVESDKTNCYARSYYGRTLFELNEYETACSALDQAILTCQKGMYDEPHYYSGVCYMQKGDKLKAESRFKEVLTIYADPKYKEQAKSMLELIR